MVVSLPSPPLREEGLDELVGLGHHLRPQLGRPLGQGHGVLVQREELVELQELLDEVLHHGHVALVGHHAAGLSQDLLGGAQLAFSAAASAGASGIEPHSR
jgi:hypothetical protein